MSDRARWIPVFPLGYSSAIDSMGSVAAPLLASVTAGIIVFVATDEKAFRWPTPTLILLFASFFALVGAVQLSFRARMYVASPTDFEEWYPGSDLAEARRRYQRYHLLQFNRWASRAGLAYDLGITALFAALVAITVPRLNHHHHASHGRWLIVALATLGFLIEAASVAHTRYRNRRPKPLVLPEVDPEMDPDSATP